MTDVTPRRLAGATALLMAAGLLPMAASSVSSSAATEAAASTGVRTANPALRAGGAASFERSLNGWSRAGSATRLDRVSFGRGAHSSAARIRPPRGRSATIGLTDAPALVRSSRARARYEAKVWVKASKAALRAGPLKVRLSLGELNGKGAGPTGWRLTRVSNHAWHQVSVPLTARHKGRRLDLTVRAIDVPSGGAVLVDDVRLKRVKRPSTSNRSLAGTRFGASVDEGNMEWRSALRRSDRKYSRMEVIRMYEPVIRNGWDGKLGEAKRPISVSFAAPPQEVLSGRHDAMLRTWFRKAPNGHPIWWTYWHEPEDDIAAGRFSASQYRRAWRHINAIARRVGTPNLHPTLTLMAWTARSASGRRVSDYYPGDFIDVMAWDGYNPPGAHGYAPAREIFGSAVAQTKRRGNRFAIGELGSVLVPGDEGSRRAQWLVATARYAAAHHAAFVCYWNARIPNENYQLFDVPSQLAWRSVVKD